MLTPRFRPVASLLPAALFAVLSVGAAAAQTPAAAPASAPQDPVAQTRALINRDDYAEAEKMARGFIAQGKTGEGLEAFSWLGRGQLAKGRLAQAMTYAMEAERMSVEALKSRALDAEPHLPIALGAALEVQAQALAQQKQLADAVVLLQKNIEAYKTTSIFARLQKNLLMLTLEGKPAPGYQTSEYVGATAPPTIQSLKGKVTMLFFWAHWCPDCKRMAASLRELQASYRDQGFVIVAPTQRYGYVAKRAPADPPAEMKYIGEVIDEFYKGIDWTVPVSEDSFAQHGSSTTPTIVLVDRQGVVRLYHPGQMTKAELEPYIQKLVGAASSAAPR